MANLGEMVVKIVGDNKDLDRSLDQSQKKITNFGKVFNAAIVATVVAGVAKISKELITAASDAEETANKFNVTFSGIRDEADLVAENLSENFGLSTTAAQDLLAATGDLLTGFGFTQESALGLADEVNQLAVDLASFTNFSGGAEGASAALTKALLGERESVKSLGISILEADVQAKVFELSQQGITFETERQAKAFATLKIAQEQSKNAIGDFARSQDSFANQTRQARAAIEDLAVELGKNVLPIATGAVSVFAQVTGKLAELAAASNEFSAATKAVNEGTATTEQTLQVLNQRLAQQEATLKATSGLTQVNTKLLEAQIEATRQEIIAVQQRTLAIEEGETVAGRAAAFAAEQAEKRAEEAQAEADRQAQFLSDQQRRDEAYEKTEAGRIAFIEAEIAYYETFKESDEKAMAVLKEYREELESLTEAVEDENQAQVNFISDYTLQALDWQKKLAEDRQKKHEEELARIEEQKQAQLEAASTIYNGLTAVVGSYFDYKLSLYDQDSQEYKDQLLAQFYVSQALSAVNAGIAGAEATIKTFNALADAGPIVAGIAAAAVGTLAAAQVGFILAQQPPAFADGGIVMPTPGGTIARVAEAGQPEVIFPLDKLESMMGTKGGNMSFVLNVDGKKLAKVIAPYYGDGIVRLNI